MADNTVPVIVEDREIQSMIYTFRGKQVMVDSNLADLYQVTTKRLNEQVRRNLDRFPSDFMFQLENQEVMNLRSQIATAGRYPAQRNNCKVFT